MAAAAVAGRAAAAALLVLQRVRVAHAAATVRVVVVRAGFVAAVLVSDLQCAACAACSQPDQSGCTLYQVQPVLYRYVVIEKQSV